jgi:glutathione S-transferase
MIEHCNICARIHLYLKLNKLEDLFTIKEITQSEIGKKAFHEVSHKAPLLVLTDRTIIFDAFVIMQYLEDKYGT